MEFSSCLRILPVLALSLAFSSGASADTVRVAAAANFSGPLKTITALFKAETGHDALVTSASTGKLYAQIKNGAPFDVFFSADAKTPARMKTEGMISGTPFTYAVGKLALYSTTPGLVKNEQTLKDGKFSHIAVANPKTAPYGAAAMETIGALKLTDALKPKFVTGENIGQTYGFVASGNAEVGFVALSQIMDKGKIKSGSVWIVPAKYYKPIRQDAALLKNADGNEAAKAFLKFVKDSPKVRKVLKDFGYSR